MAVMLSELLSEHKSQFKLTLLAGAQSLEVPVNWSTWWRTPPSPPISGAGSWW